MRCNALQPAPGRGAALLLLALLLVPAAAWPLTGAVGPAALRADPTLFPTPDAGNATEADATAVEPDQLPAPGAGPESADVIPVAEETPAAEVVATEPVEPPDPTPEVVDALRALLAGPLTEVYRPKSLRAFYAGRADQPVWLQRGMPSEPARALYAAVVASAGDGLEPADYHQPALQLLLDSDATLAPPAAARLDLLLSDAFLRLAAHLASGRHRPDATDPDWHIPVHQADTDALLPQVAAGRSVTEALESERPHHPAYDHLRQALALYRTLAETGGWPTLPPGDTLEPEMRDERVVTLRQHLQLTGDAPAGEPADPLLFDPQLTQAVIHFQERHGLEPDGKVGRKTRATLNVSADERVEQLRLNLERWRWLPRDFGPRYVLVNVAAFELAVMQKDEELLAMRVIIGQRFQSTPAFTERMTYLELNPYWNVPAKITREEILPKLAEEPDYLERNHMRILRGWSSQAEVVPTSELDWTPESGTRFPYRIQQLPGPTNALGRIKFMFPNRFSIYLHDTPARHLFRRTVRTFSHGCIRIEKPMEMARLVLEGSGWTPERIQYYLDRGEHKIVGLPKPIPVYVVYLTAWMDGSGTVQFRDDVYGRDRRMAQTLSALVDG